MTSPWLSAGSPEIQGASPPIHQLYGILGTYFQLHTFTHTYFYLSK